MIFCVFIFDISVFQKPYAICNKKHPANKDNNIIIDCGIKAITAFAHNAPAVINTKSANTQPRMQKKPALYPLVIEIFAVVMKTGPTEINTKKHK